jgi:GT2 family glycosyltransferase
VIPCSFKIGNLTGFCFIVRREVFRIIGYFDEQFEKGLYEDADFNARLWHSGHPPVEAQNVLIHHFEGRTLINEPRFKYYAVNAERL